MTRSTTDFAAWWDKRAPGYDAHTVWLERRLFAEERRRLCALARGSTLEIGVGTGANLPYYPTDIELTGIDWSSAMVALAKERAQTLKHPASLQQADAMALPFPPESFDTVLSTLALCCVPDERRVVTEALRVLRPGGSLLLLDHVASSVWPVRVLQRGLELMTVPLQNEHFTRPELGQTG